jgi:hypothetical protein
LHIVCTGEGEVMSIDNEKSRDPRTRLMREKYFNIRPRPLERWFWAQGVPASAERVFWLHWQEGLQRGDWCSEVPLRRVAQECHLDVSTVTRAYQLLAKLGCIRRTDPGRNPANPFQQATAVTEVRMPREVLAELDRFPNRRAGAAVQRSEDSGEGCRRSDARDVGAAARAVVPEAAESADPLAGLSGRERVRALAELTASLSASEQRAYQEALRLHRGQMAFDRDSKVLGETKSAVLRVLALMAAGPRPTEEVMQVDASVRTGGRVYEKGGARRLSVFELSRLRRDIQAATCSSAAPELLRQVIWSIESGALRRFSTLHAVHIALKKIRLGSWTRPHRMPPQWTPAPCGVVRVETCRTA